VELKIVVVPVKNASSLTLTDHCFLDVKSGLILGQSAKLEMAHFSSLTSEGGLKLGDRSQLIIDDYSKVKIGNRGNLSLNNGGRVLVEEFSSLIISDHSGLKIEPGMVLALKNHASLEITNNTWLKMTRKVVVEERNSLLISSQNEIGKSIGFEYVSEEDFQKSI